MDNVLVLSASDVKLSYGSVGIRSNGAATIDDFSASALTTLTPFSDNFDTTTGSLGTPWFGLLGQFSGGNGSIQGTAKTNLATVAGVVLSDADVSAQVSVGTGKNTFASLVARYDGPGDSNMIRRRSLARQTAGRQASNADQQRDNRPCSTTVASGRTFFVSSPKDRRWNCPLTESCYFRNRLCLDLWQRRHPLECQRLAGRLQCKRDSMARPDNVELSSSRGFAMLNPPPNPIPVAIRLILP